jgi:hypothetical protein
VAQGLLLKQKAPYVIGHPWANNISSVLFPTVMIDSSEFGKPIRWLFRETLVVVLGVLIAIGVNDYWNERQERILEREYLTRLLEDVAADIEYVRSARSMLDRKLQALDAIAPVVRGLAPVPNDLETFLRNVALGGLGGASSTYWITDTTFEDMKATGSLRLIRDAEMRRRIVRYYGDFETFFARSRDRKTGYVSFVHSRLPSELRDDMDLSDMEKFGAVDAMEEFMSPEFQYLLNQEYNYAYFNQQNNIGPTAEELAQQIKEYLSSI